MSGDDPKLLAEVVRFEIRYLLRNPLLWVTAAVTFALFFVSMSVHGFELGAEGGLLANAAYATLRNYLMLSVLFLFVTTSFVANAILRDDETGFAPIIRSTRLTPFEYVIGRFTGAFSVAALLMLVVPLAIWIGTRMPWADPAILGPNRLADHLYGYFLIALPNLLLSAALFFALATITRSMMATYLGVIVLVSGWFVLQGATRDPRFATAVALADPFGARALSDATRYWTVAERNVLLPAFQGALLQNRLLWLGVSVVCLPFAYIVYRFAGDGMSKRQRKRLAPQAAAEDMPQTPPASLPKPRHDRATLRALLWMRTRFEAVQVMKSPAFVVLMAWGLFTTYFVLLTQRDPDGRPTYPTTLPLIPEIEDAFRLIPLIVAIYYAGELVWRERDRRIHELIDATPLPNWAYVVPKTAALALVLVAMLVVNVVASVTIQLSLGYTELELGKYLLWYVLPASVDMLLLAALAIFVQSLSPHKTVGWGVMVLFLLWQQLNTTIEHNLLNYGGTPPVPLSDMNGAGSFWKGAWTFRLYWGAFAILLLVAAHLLWRRGTETRLRTRLTGLRQRLVGGPQWIAVGALLTFVATGAYAYYNTNILNDYRTRSADDDDAADLEKRYWKYHDLPQPTIADVTLDIALEPDERRAVTKGRYRLRNLTDQPIPDIHLRILDRDLRLTRATITGARLISNDPRHDYRIYHLDRPMQPGEERLLTFETQRWQRGFRNSHPNTRLVENGTFLSESELMPLIGIDGGGLLQDNDIRRAYGLPDAPQPPKLEDLAVTRKTSFSRTWTRTDITLSTSADQTPIAPGNRISDITRDGRRIARFVSQAPIHPLFSVQSARYAERHRRHAGIDLAVYFHPAHPWNIERMLDAMAASLDYDIANFGPYPFDHIRIVEFPGYRDYAQAFAGTIPYAETVGFTADHRQPDTLDHLTGMTAHEFAHQYWAHQIIGAEMEGATVLTETLAQYSAAMVVKKLRGEDQIRRYLQFELDRYLEARAHASTPEPPLARETGQHHITYRKGALAMYLLQKRLGEERVNRALRSLLARDRFKSAPYPRSLDLIDALRAEARFSSDQALITDLFERVTLYELKVVGPKAVRRGDGRWEVTVPVEARKFYVSADGSELITPLDERIEVGLFTAEPGRDAFSASSVLLLERHAIRSGRQVLRFVTERKPGWAGVDPYTFYIDRDSGDNVGRVE